MTYDEYDKKIKEVLGNPDTALANISAVMDALKNDLTTLESARSENESLQARVKDLQDTNMKLYLSITGSDDEPEDNDPAEGNGVIDELMDILFDESEDK